MNPRAIAAPALVIAACPTSYAPRNQGRLAVTMSGGQCSVAVLGGAAIIGTAALYQWDAIHLFNDAMDARACQPPGAS